MGGSRDARTTAGCAAFLASISWAANAHVLRNARRDRRLLRLCSLHVSALWCVSAPGVHGSCPNGIAPVAGVYFDEDSAKVWMGSNFLSLAFELVVQQPAVIVTGTVINVILGPIVAAAVIDRASRLLPIS